MFTQHKGLPPKRLKKKLTLLSMEGRKKGVMADWLFRGAGGVGVATEVEDTSGWAGQIQDTRNE